MHHRLDGIQLTAVPKVTQQLNPLFHIQGITEQTLAGDGITSNSLMWAAGDEDGIKSHGIVVENSSYWQMCNPKNVHWEQSKGGFAGDTVDATERQFKPRSPPSVDLCWHQQQ